MCHSTAAEVESGASMVAGGPDERSTSLHPAWPRGPPEDHARPRERLAPCAHGLRGPVGTTTTVDHEHARLKVFAAQEGHQDIVRSMAHSEPAMGPCVRSSETSRQLDRAKSGHRSTNGSGPVQCAQGGPLPSSAAAPKQEVLPFHSSDHTGRPRATQGRSRGPRAGSGGGVGTGRTDPSRTRRGAEGSPTRKG